MLTITSKANYGLSAVLELASHYGNGVVQIKDISARRNIPKNYLEQLLNRLLKSGLIKSTRGNKGGYALADKPENILLLDVLEALEGNIKLTGNMENSNALYKHFKNAEQQMKKSLTVTLKEIVDEQADMRNGLTFQI